MRPATAEEIAESLSFGLRYDGRRRVHHADEAMAKWLHEKLESFHVPSSIAGQLSENGIVPSRLKPIFRDRGELAKHVTALDQAVRDYESARLVYPDSHIHFDDHHKHRRSHDDRGRHRDRRADLGLPSFLRPAHHRAGRSGRGPGGGGDLGRIGWPIFVIAPGVVPPTMANLMSSR